MPGVVRTIRSASLQGYPEVAGALGLDAAHMLRRAGLPSRCLNDLQTPISLDAARKLLESSAQAAGVEDFGLRLARQRRLSNLGPISLALREEPTGWQALETLCRHLHYVTAALLTKVEQMNELVYIRVELLWTNPAPARQAMEMTVGMMFQTLRELLGTQWRPRRVWSTQSNWSTPRATASTTEQGSPTPRRCRGRSDGNSAMAAARAGSIWARVSPTDRPPMA